MKYRIGYRDAAERQLLRLDAIAQKRIVAAIDKLADDPRPQGCGKLRGRSGYRIRVGEYRVVYDIHDRQIVVEIIAIGHRRDIYR